MTSPRALSSGACRLLCSLLLLFLVGSVSAQYTTASDGDYCFDPDFESTTTSSSTRYYSNSTASATSRTSGSNVSTTSTSGASFSPAPTSGAMAVAIPEIVLGLVAALVAI
ncbi:hypothetical protein B0T14DRAFT_344011 [Immersiella caudata]|uniref:Uncharacterized protein n=1 Tax=Immersiella caudata TaxID=314043 RepID=A0AA39WA48_9PEZI|nr:hypothetical protein B0T14DRAFT_344011 [Immersiella caudata]